MRIDTVSGALDKARRRPVEKAVGEVVDRWWDRAFVTSYPRKGFGHSFAGFTKAAAAQARADGTTTTNRTLGRRIDGLVATRRTVALDVLATDGAARAATARVLLRFRTTGEVRRTQEVRGRLYLTKQPEWRVFGFDLSQQRVVKEPGKGSKDEKGSQKKGSQKKGGSR